MRRWGFLFVGVSFPDKKIREAAVRIEANDAFGLGDEIGKRVDIVVEKAAGGVVDDVFDAADFHSGELHDALDGGDDFARRLVGFDGETVFRRVNRAAGAAFEFFAASALADVTGAEVVSFSSGADADGVEIISAEDFDAGDDAVARSETFLDESGLIHAKAEAIFVDGFLEFLWRIEALDASAAAADIGLDDERVADGFGGFHHLQRLIDDAGFRVIESEGVEIRKLNGFGDFVCEGSRAVDDADAFFFEVLQIIERVKDSVAIAALPGGGAHTI